MRRVIQLEGVYDDEGRNESSCVIQLATEDDVTLSQDKRRSRILETVSARPGITKTKIAEAVGGRKVTVMNEVNALLVNGALRIEIRNRTQHVYVADVPGSGSAVPGREVPVPLP
jgi:hypothetical protein